MKNNQSTGIASKVKIVTTSVFISNLVFGTMYSLVEIKYFVFIAPVLTNWLAFTTGIRLRDYLTDLRFNAWLVALRPIPNPTAKPPPSAYSTRSGNDGLASDTVPGAVATGLLI